MAAAAEGQVAVAAAALLHAAGCEGQVAVSALLLAAAAEEQVAVAGLLLPDLLLCGAEARVGAGCWAVAWAMGF